MSPPIDVDIPPNYEQDSHRVFNDWEVAHSAALSVNALQVELLKKQVQLGVAQRALSKRKEQSAAKFTKIHKKKGNLSGLLSFGKSKEESQAEKERQEAQASFEESHSEERQQADTVKKLENTVKGLTSKRDAVIEQVATSDTLWSGIQSTSHGRIPGAEEMDAEDTLHKTDADVEEAHRQVAALTRARLSMQHAHKYFSDGLKVCDDLNPGSKLGSIAEGFGGDLVSMSKQNDYKAAIRQAEKAQSCLEECIRCLEPYWYTISGEIAADFDALKASGVMQIKRIYDLMYEGSASNVKDSVRIMLERQESVFKQLTRTAVWTQDRVPECEIAESHAKIRREEARGHLAAFWKR